MAEILVDRLDEVIRAATQGGRVRPGEEIGGPRIRLISYENAQASVAGAIREFQVAVRERYGIDLIVIGGGAGCFTIEFAVRDIATDGPKIATKVIRELGNDPDFLDQIRDLPFKIVITEDRGSAQSPSRHYQRALVPSQGRLKPVDFLILTALQDPEFVMLRKRMHMRCGHEERDFSKDQDAFFYTVQTHTEARWRVMATYLPRVGNLSAATETMRLLEVWKPKYLIFVGIAGRVGSDGLELGDVVVGDQIYHYDVRRKEAEQNTQYAPVVYQADPGLLRYVRHLMLDDSFQEDWRLDLVHEGCEGHSRPKAVIGDIACGDGVLDSSSKNREITALNRKIQAVENESAGMLEAIRTREFQIKPLVVRGISDLADGTKQDHWQAYAAETAAAFAVDFIRAFHVDHEGSGEPDWDGDPARDSEIESRTDTMLGGRSQAPPNSERI